MREINTNNIVIISDKKSIIKKGDVKKDAEIVIIPKSIKKIEKDAFFGIGYPWTFIYLGTQKQFEKIDTQGEICTPCVNCTDGVKILSI